jgi:hypothetical protein
MKNKKAMTTKFLGIALGIGLLLVILLVIWGLKGNLTIPNFQFV